MLEPDLDELVRRNGKAQTFTSAITDLGKCDVVYIAPDVPTNDLGESDLTGIRKLIEAVTVVLRPDAVLVVLCQVPPGFTRGLAAPPTERRYYQVETLVFGRAVERATQPERYIIGCADPAKPLDPRFRAVLAAFDCPILPMRYESAELAKISINMCLVASVGVANTMAELCEQIGAVWSEIVPSLKLDKRIGPSAIWRRGWASPAVILSAISPPSSAWPPGTAPTPASSRPGCRTAATAAAGPPAPSNRCWSTRSPMRPSPSGGSHTRKTPTL